MIVGVVVISIIPLVFMIVSPIIRKKHLARVAMQPFPKSWEDIINRRLPIYGKMPKGLQDELKRNIQIFIFEKKFYGCEGLEINDEIKVTIAAQASTLLLNRKSSYYNKLEAIYVYPYAYISKHKQAIGNGQIVIESAGVNLGESWEHGSIVLSWDSSWRGAMNIHDGHNVVLHEFAHQLDQEDGRSDGVPIMEQSTNYLTWAKVAGQEYQELLDKTARHKKTVMDKYGATNEAEFFAVATETFFEKPKQLRKKHPELYDELKNYYKLNPLEWV